MDVVLKKKKDVYFLFKSLFKVQITSNDNFNFFLKKKKKKNHLVTLIQEKKKKNLNAQPFFLDCVRFTRILSWKFLNSQVIPKLGVFHELILLVFENLKIWSIPTIDGILKSKQKVGNLNLPSPTL